MKVICCFSQMANGKDTISDHLAIELNKCSTEKWQRIGFANAVKKVFMDTFKVTWDFIEEWKRKDTAPPGFNLNIRKSLQFIGDGFRQIQSDIWIQTALRDKVPKIISDGRYINEAKSIRSHGGLNILLWRDGFENNDPNPSESQIKPTVEWFVKNKLEGDMRSKNLPEEVNHVAYPSLFDFFIRNEGTKEQLYRKVDTIIPIIKDYHETFTTS